MMNRPLATTGWLNAKGAARILNVCDRTVSNWVKSGYLVGRLVGPQKRVRVRREDVLRLKATWQMPLALDYKAMAAGERSED